MRTVEEFIAIVEKENEQHNDELLSLSSTTLIARAWEIAKWQAIYDYIMEVVIPCIDEEELMNFLTLEIDEPISTIYSFELEYDEAMWTTWDNLNDVVREMFRAIKNQNN